MGGDGVLSKRAEVSVAGAVARIAVLGAPGPETGIGVIDVRDRRGWPP